MLRTAHFHKTGNKDRGGCFVYISFPYFQVHEHAKVIRKPTISLNDKGIKQYSIVSLLPYSILPCSTCVPAVPCRPDHFSPPFLHSDISGNKDSGYARVCMGHVICSYYLTLVSVNKNLKEGCIVHNITEFTSIK